MVLGECVDGRIESLTEFESFSQKSSAVTPSCSLRDRTAIVDTLTRRVKALVMLCGRNTAEGAVFCVVGVPCPTDLTAHAESTSKGRYANVYVLGGGGLVITAERLREDMPWTKCVHWHVIINDER